MNSNKSILLTVVAACVVVLATCAASPGLRLTDPASLLTEGEAYEEPTPSQIRDAIVSGGLSLVGKQSLVVNGKSYPADCTGLVRAAYSFADIDLAYRFGDYGGNGVRRVYLTLYDLELVYATAYPAPGDLVFWDNTWDADGNKVADDELTHVGMVVAAEPDGMISYLHYHYRLGPTVETMNLLQPDLDSAMDGSKVNAVLRMRGSPPGPGSNAAQLFKAFGKGYGLDQ